MELQQLRYFVAVAEQRNFTRAARDLAVAQPSISKQIRRLEEELGTVLFQRGRDGVTLTHAGDALLAWARRILDGVDGARAEVRDLARLERGRLSVGATPSLSTVLLPPILSRFHAAHPGIEIRVSEAGSRDLVGQVERGECELAFVILPVPDDMSAEPMMREELVLATTRTDALARRRTVTIAELRGVPLVMFREGYDLRAATLVACQQAGFEATLAVEGGEMDSVLRLVAAGLGVAVVPSMVVDRGGPLVAVRLRPPLTRTIGLAHRRDWTLSRAADAFAQVATAYVGSGELPKGVAALASVRPA